MRVAYQGVPGAFSHEACLTFMPEYEAMGEPTFEAVVEVVALGEKDYGVLPLENSAVGPVEGVAELIAAAPVEIVARHSLPIRLHLLGLPGTDISTVTTAVSHPMALKQCARTLAELGLAAQPAINTAVAAQSLADPASAVLASEAAAEAYGLAILRRDVQDHRENATIFAVIAKRGR